MGERRTSVIERILQRIEERVEEWRERDRALEREAETSRDAIWAEAAERERLLRTFVEKQAERIGAEDAVIARAHLRLGRPDQEIVRLGEELGAGLIVMGSRGLDEVRRALMGSVSDSVVRHAHGSVLVIQGEDHG